MAGYIGSKSSVTQVDGYNQAEADAEFVAKAGGTMTGALTGTDLYLSGGAYLGGVGASNKLDDYEEGTWTPVLYGTTVAGTWSPSAAAGGGYVKVGNQVTCWMNVNGDLSGASGAMQISGLPFTNASNGLAGRYNAVYSTGALQYWSGVNRMVTGPLTLPGTTVIYFHTYSAAGSGSSSGANPPVINGNHNIHAFVTYMVS